MPPRQYTSAAGCNVPSEFQAGDIDRGLAMRYPDPVHVLDVGRPGRVITELSAQLLDKGTDPVRVTRVRPIPDLED